jgi:hypothetical protein
MAALLQCSQCYKNVPKEKYYQAITKANKRTPCPESASELYRQSESRLSAKLVPNFAEEGCGVVSAADPLLP